MKVLSGMSAAVDAAEAVAEATRSWNKKDEPHFMLVFHSTRQDPHAIAAELSKRFPGVPFAGCTTAGEHLNGQHYNGSLVLTGIHSPEIRWRVAVIESLKDFDEAGARRTADELLQSLELDRDDISPEKQFCLNFIDGLSLKEEVVSALLAEALEGIPLLGGSAGDDLQFKKTHVLAQGKAYAGAAVIVMADSQLPFRVIKHQHFLQTPAQLVVTKVDTPQRRVYELDGMPAVEAYAAALGVTPEQLTGDVSFVHPLMFRVNNEFYVRSIQKIESDGSIIFYCGVEEGMVLEVGGHEVIDEALQRAMQAEEISKAELFIACNCILRALETQQEKKHEVLGKITSRLSPHIIGFDTYGEQLNGLHFNQTLVGLALGRAAS